MITLSPREQEVMARYALCGSYKVVAWDMGISLPMAKDIYLRAARRLGVSGSIAVFRDQGWLVVPEEAMTWREAQP